MRRIVCDRQLRNRDNRAFAISPGGAPAPQSQARTSLLNPEPGDVAQGGEVLDRIAAQGLDKAPQR